MQTMARAPAQGHGPGPEKPHWLPSSLARGTCVHVFVCAGAGIRAAAVPSHDYGHLFSLCPASPRPEAPFGTTGTARSSEA
jgi:hypothetical protein